MATKTLQIRDLDEGVLDVLKARAAMARMSLSAYAAEQLTQLASMPTNAEVMGRAWELARSSDGVSDTEIVDVIREGRDR